MLLYLHMLNEEKGKYKPDFDIVIGDTKGWCGTWSAVVGWCGTWWAVVSPEKQFDFIIWKTVVMKDEYLLVKWETLNHSII